MINIFSSSRYKIDREKIKKAVMDFLSKKNLDKEKIIINIIFSGRNKIKKITERYKNEKEVLPVLSFSYNEKQEEKIFLGEIFVCYPLAVLLAAERNKKVDETINNLIIHGLENII